MERMIRSLAVKKHLIIMTLLFCLINITAQHPSNVYRFGIHGSATYNNYFTGGCGMAYFITPNISTEINIGGLFKKNINYNYDLGFKYWITTKGKTSGFLPFVGLAYNRMGIINEKTYGLSNVLEQDHYKLFKIPVGISYLAKCGAETTIQFSYANNLKFSFHCTDITLRIGWRFKRK
ncbi:MAG TPA: hypothetical protein PK978_06480 [Paludibacter sp.]|nr:hypothetical protein [Paludibacter sp.]